MHCIKYVATIRTTPLRKLHAYPKPQTEFCQSCVVFYLAYNHKLQSITSLLFRLNYRIQRTNSVGMFSVHYIPCLTVMEKKLSCQHMLFHFINTIPLSAYHRFKRSDDASSSILQINDTRVVAWHKRLYTYKDINTNLCR